MLLAATAELFTAASGYCQNKPIAIINSKEQPVTFATASINHRLYYRVDEKGLLSLPTTDIKQGDTIYISSLGYKSQNLAIINPKLLPEKICLEETVLQLDEISVSNNSKNYTTAKMGEMSSFTISKYLPNPNQQLALFIANSSQRKGFINNITFFLKNTLNGIENPFRVRLYDRKPGSQFPDKELMDEMVVQNTKKKTFFTIDISKYGVSLPQDGFFVVFELLPRQYYDENHPVIRSNKSLGVTYLQYYVPCLAMSSFVNKNSPNYSLIRQVRKNDPESLIWYRSNTNFLIEAELSIYK